MISNVYEFHEKFGLPTGKQDILTGKDNFDALKFRVKFMQEELAEFIEAMGEEDRVKAFDALLDLTYVVYGTALFMGIDPAQWHAGMTAVHNANMAKERAISADQSKRGTALDVIKPAGWEGPEARLKQILDWDLAKVQGELDL